MTGDGGCPRSYGAGGWPRAISPDGRLLARADHGILRLWDVATTAELRGVGDPDDGQSSVAFSPDGKVLVATGIDADIRFRNVAGILWARSSGP
jgi:WD40 repeat protein